MMSFLFIFLLTILLEYRKGCASGINKDPIGFCRDYENKRVAWWYIYKPPADVFEPHMGTNFSFVTPATEGRWIQSPGDITDSDVNMLSHTMAPIYQQSSQSNQKYKAVVLFETRHGTTRTSARGVVVAEPEGGFLLMHTVPGFPVNIDSPDPVFPTEELEHGHLLSCISLDIDALNKVAKALKGIEANITHVNVPTPLRVILKEWHFESPSRPISEVPLIYRLIRANESGVLGGPSGIAAALVARPPGVKNCIYASFATRQLVMLNVYGQSRSTYLTTVCGKGFGVRNLESLCMKLQYPDGGVYYVTNSTDYSWFAVSTAAHWQQQGSGLPQYWVCTSSVDKEDPGEGGLLLCLQNYNLWVAFDNLKVAEPTCD